MNLSFHYLLGLITSFIASLVSCAMLLLVLWQAPIRRENLWTALYFAAIVVWGIAVFFMRLQCIAGQSPALTLSIIGWAFQFAGFSIFMVLCYHARLFGQRTIQALVAFGALMLGVSAYLYTTNSVLHNALCAPLNHYTFDALPGSRPILATIGLFSCVNLWIALRHRKTGTSKVLMGTLWFFAGVLVTPIEILRAATLPLLFAALSTILFTHVVLKTNLFTPLAEATRKAKLQSAAKTQFLARMSHALRTPLHNILGYSELVLEDLSDKKTQNAQNDLRRVMVSGKHLLSLVEDVIDVAKIEEGKLKLSPVEIEISKFVMELEANITPLLAKNKNDFKVRGLEKTAEVRIRCDRKRLYQVLINLLGNAAKFTLEGSIALSLEATENAFVFQVMDTGMGMNEEQCARIFDEYEQADEYLTKRQRGSGLGLPVSRRLVRLMGGELSCTSAFGRGSCFELRIPLEMHARPSMAPAQGSNRESKEP